MPNELDIRSATINYTVRFDRPVFELWGRGDKIVRSLYDALSGYGITLASVTVAGGLPNAAEPVITVRMHTDSTVKFAFDRIEFNFNNFSQEFFSTLPVLYQNCIAWLRREAPELKLAQHNFAYFCHALAKGAESREILARINPHRISEMGENLGSGAIIHSFLRDKNWLTRFWFDFSNAVPGGLFIALFIDVTADELNYQQTWDDARAYYRRVLTEVDLSLPQYAQ
jgi:hypothetical protein